MRCLFQVLLLCPRRERHAGPLLQVFLGRECGVLSGKIIRAVHILAWYRLGSSSMPWQSRVQVSFQAVRMHHPVCVLQLFFGESSSLTRRIGRHNRTFSSRIDMRSKNKTNAQFDYCALHSARSASYSLLLVFRSYRYAMTQHSGVRLHIQFASWHSVACTCFLSSVGTCIQNTYPMPSSFV